jgi:YlmC/YmxH family sporulation protein
MRLSELEGKEIINLYDAGRLGTVRESDLVIDPECGEIESVLIPGRGSFFNLMAERHEMMVPWTCVKKIGIDLMIVDLDQTYSIYKR